MTCDFILFLDLTHLSTGQNNFPKILLEFKERLIIYTIKCSSPPNYQRSQSSEPKFIRHVKGVQTFSTYCKLGFRNPRVGLLKTPKQPLPEFTPSISGKTRGGWEKWLWYSDSPSFPQLPRNGYSGSCILISWDFCNYKTRLRLRLVIFFLLVHENWILENFYISLQHFAL